MAPDAGAQSPVDRRARRRGEVSRQRAHDVGIDTGVPLRRLGRKGRHQRAQPAQPVSLRADPPRVDEVLVEHHLQQRQQQVGVGVRHDPAPFERRRRLGSAWIDHHHPPAAFDDVVHPVLDPRRGQETAVRHNRIRADHDQKVGAVQVRYRYRDRGAVEQLTGHQPAVGVLGGGRIEVGAAAQALDERQDRHHVGVAERPRIAHVPADRARPVLAHDAREPFSDIGQRFVPTDLLETGGSAPQRHGHPVGIVDHLGERDAFLARESGGQRAVPVGSQRDEPAVFDGGDHAAQRLTDAAERHLVFDVGGGVGHVIHLCTHRLGIVSNRCAGLSTG